jgi:4-amino-4-deoxy-L-arabinose transferase-like glycosyltransferase
MGNIFKNMGYLRQLITGLNRNRILLLILFLSLFMRVYGLAKDGFHTDEYFSFYTASHSVSDILFQHQEITNVNNIPPLYEIILHFWINLAGNSDVVQRIPSVIFGFIGVFFVYLLAKLMFDKRTGLISSFLFSSSLIVLYISRISRSYSLFSTLVIISFYLFFLILNNEGKKKKKSLIGLFLINVLLLYTHYFAFLVIFCQFVIGAAEQARGNKTFFKDIILVHLGALLLFSFWIPNFLFDLNNEPLINILHNNNYPPWEMLGSIFIIGGSQGSVFLFIIYSIFIVFSVYKYINRDRNILYLLFIFIILLTAVFFLTQQINRARYYVWLIFPFYILLARGIDSFKWSKIVLILIGSLFVIDGYFLHFFQGITNEEWKQHAEYIKKFESNTSGNMAIFFPYEHSLAVFSYYFWGKKTGEKILKPDFQEGFLSGEKEKGRLMKVLDSNHLCLSPEKLKELIEPVNCKWIWVMHSELEPNNIYKCLNLNQEHATFLRKIQVPDSKRPKINLYLFTVNE